MEENETREKKNGHYNLSFSNAMLDKEKNKLLTNQNSDKKRK